MLEKSCWSEIGSKTRQRERGMQWGRRMKTMGIDRKGFAEGVSKEKLPVTFMGASACAEVGW